MLTINNLTLSYKSKVVIENLELTLSEGQIHGLAGLNGSGKTTLLKAIYGYKSLDKGTIDFQQETLTKSRIAFLETTNFFYSRITGMEYLKLFQLRNKGFQIEEWNKLFELPLNTFIETYSTGMKKKLAFLGIICLDKPILILDEPFNGVDMDTSQKFKIIIKGLKEKGKTILVTSHILESLTSICDTISYLKLGKIVLTLPKSEFVDLELKIFGEFNKENEQVVSRLLGEEN